MPSSLKLSNVKIFKWTEGEMVVISTMVQNTIKTRDFSMRNKMKEGC